MTTAPPLLSLTDGPPITLSQLLTAKDLRFERQQTWLTRYNQPLLSLSLAIPGEIKRSSGALFLFETALATLTTTLQHQHLVITEQQKIIADTGYEALLTIPTTAQQLKTCCITIETTHPLGRFWDLDVFCPTQGQLSRTTQQQPARYCFICNNKAHACARSQKHSTSELVDFIEKKINTFKISNSTSL